MNNLKKNYIKKKYKKKLNYCAPYAWKRAFLINHNYIFKLAKKTIYCRSSIVTKTFKNSYVYIYAGKRWYHRLINKWMVGFKFGEFTWNRKYALYKAKQLRKKKKKK